MGTIYGEFPHDELQRFDTRAEAYNSGIDKNHLWAVTSEDDVFDENNRYFVYIYGDHSHYVNHLYHVQTAEAYAGNDFVEYVDVELSTDDKLELLENLSDDPVFIDENDPDAINKAWAQLVEKERKNKTWWVKNAD